MEPRGVVFVVMEDEGGYPRFVRVDSTRLVLDRIFRASGMPVFKESARGVRFILDLPVWKRAGLSPRWRSTLFPLSNLWTETLVAAGRESGPCREMFIFPMLRTVFSLNATREIFRD